MTLFPDARSPAACSADAIQQQADANRSRHARQQVFKLGALDGRLGLYLAKQLVG